MFHCSAAYGKTRKTLLQLRLSSYIQTMLLTFLLTLPFTCILFSFSLLIGIISNKQSSSSSVFEAPANSSVYSITLEFIKRANAIFVGHVCFDKKALSAFPAMLLPSNEILENWTRIFGVENDTSVHQTFHKIKNKKNANND